MRTAWRYGPAVATQISTTMPWDPRLLQAAMALNENRLEIAEPILKSFLKEDPFDPLAIRMLAELAGRIGRWTDAENLLRRAIEIAPGFMAARANLALVLGRTGRPAEALELLDEIFAIDQDDAGVLNLRAATLGKLGDFQEAIQLYEVLLQRTPKQPRLWLSYGHMLKTVGRQADGIAAYRHALAIAPQLGEAWWSLANLKTVHFDKADIAAMRRELEAIELADADRMHLGFALGKAMHDAGNPEQAFGYYEGANATRLKTQPYDAAKLTRSIDLCIELLTAEFFAERSGGHDAPDPIFIVGLPRAGSTLVEQILSSHSLVEGTAELPDIPAMANNLGPYPNALAKLGAAEREQLGREYLKRAGVQRRTRRPFFIDKLPNNWLFVPFIQLILPNAKIIDARRHPLACCFSNFRQHFARGQPFTYNLGDLGRYYSDYVRMMAQIDAVLPGRVHRVIYERMVDDTEAEIRRLLDYCGLDFEPQVLEFYKTDRAVRTASSEQVRRPIYRDATDEWRAYEPHLGPLKEALGPVLDTYPEAPATFPQR
jgi:tetratricopeptide (TPR) repeat protein